MKRLIAIAALALFVSACGDQIGVTSPTTIQPTQPEQTDGSTVSILD